MWGCNKTECLVQVHHGPVECIQVLVLEVVGICQIPAAAAQVQRAAVAWDELAGGGAVCVIPATEQELRS